jgi:Polyketide cyclase / dehydrase and lipid transport
MKTQQTPPNSSPKQQEEPPMQAERDAPVHAADQIEIAADPATVWDTLTDIPGWAGWMPAVRSIAAAEPIAVGARFHEKSGLVTMRSQLVQVDPEGFQNYSSPGRRGVHRRESQFWNPSDRGVQIVTHNRYARA